MDPKEKPSTETGQETIDLCGVEEVAEDEPLQVEKDGLTLAVYKVEGEIFVTDDHCTHGPGSLSGGYLEDYIIECDFHGGQFDIRTGEVVEPPCIVPIKTYKVTQQDGRVLIEVDR